MQSLDKETEVKFVDGLTTPNWRREGEAPHFWKFLSCMWPAFHLHMHCTYRPYAVYSTDVDIGIQTVVQTVVICGTDVQTVQY